MIVIHNYKINLEKLLKKTLVFIVFLVLYFTSYARPELSGFLTIFISLIVIDLIFIYRLSQTIFLVFIYILSHIVMFIPFFFFDSKLVRYTAFQNEFYFGSVVRNLALFIMIVWIGSQKIGNLRNNKLELHKGLKFRNNSILFFISVCLMMFIIIFGRTGESIFVVGGYTNLGNVSTFRGLAIYEYFIIFFLLAYKYAQKKDYPILLLLAIAYSGKAIIFGSRNELLQLGLMIFILFIDGKISYKILIPGLLIAGYFLSFLGVFRATLDLSLFDIKYFNIFRIFSTQSSVIYSSSVLEAIRITGFFNPLQLLQAFSLFGLSIFLPSQTLPEIANFTRYAQVNFSYHMGGGIVTSYFYSWLGIFGVLFIALLFTWVLKCAFKATKYKNEYLVFFTILAFSNTIRWFSYSPITFFKMGLFGIIVLWMFNQLEKLLSKN